MPSLKFPLSLEISSLCSESADGSIDIRNIDTNTNTIKDTNTNSNTSTNTNRNDWNYQIWNILSSFGISSLCSESAAGSNDIGSNTNTNKNTNTNTETISEKCQVWNFLFPWK